MTRGACVLALIMIAPLPRLESQKPQVAGSEATFRTDVDVLSVAVRVTDRKDNEIHGLTADRFSLFEDGILQKISFFASEEEPVSLGILLDVSSSMASTGKLDHAKDALSPLIRAIRPEDEMFYLRFHRQVERIVDFTSDQRSIVSAIAKTGATQDGTSLYDAVARALCYMRSAHHHRRALLVVTDGADQHSHRSLEELIPIVQASQAQVFIIGYFGNEEYDLYRSSRNRNHAGNQPGDRQPGFGLQTVGKRVGRRVLLPGITCQASGGSRCRGASTSDAIYTGLLSQV